MQDQLLPFILENLNLRGVSLQLGSAIATILSQRDYPTVIKKYLSELLAAATLLTAPLKFKGTLTLELRTSGSVKWMVAKCNEKLEIRGLATWEQDISEFGLKKDILNGQIVVTIQQENQKKPYQAVVPIANHSISEALEAYFKQSEQLNTKVYIAYENKKVAGLLLQQLPGDDVEKSEDSFQHAVCLADTLSSSELLEDSKELLLKKLFHEEDVRIFSCRDVNFNCTCSTGDCSSPAAMLQVRLPVS